MYSKVTYDAYLQFGEGAGTRRTVKCFECRETEYGRVILRVGGEWDLRVRVVHGLPSTPWITLLGEKVDVCILRKGT